MSNRSVIPSFQPTAEWYDDWPHGVSTSVQVLASITGPAAAPAVQRFLHDLNHNPDADVPDGVSLYYQGGFVVESTPPIDGGTWRIMLRSAGEDGFDSLESAADDLTTALRETPGEVQLAWHELPSTKVE